jgi:hypothetical protein
MHTKQPFFVQYGALIASATALFIAIGGNWLRSKVFKSDLRVIGFRNFKQQENLIVWRIILQNKGHDTAENVQADVIEISDDGKKRGDFLPIPLKWTHLDTESRNILVNQTVHLDIFDEIHNSQGSPAYSNLEIRLGTRFGLNIRKFTFLESGKAKLKIVVFQKSGSNIEIDIEAEKDNDNRIFSAKLFQPIQS